MKKLAKVLLLVLLWISIFLVIGVLFGGIIGYSLYTMTVSVGTSCLIGFISGFAGGWYMANSVVGDLI